jgi:hypothetical protein
LFGKGKFTRAKKRKLGPKIIDCAFLGYAHSSTGYRF